MIYLLYILLYFLIGTITILLAIFMDVLDSPFYKPNKKNNEGETEYIRRVKLYKKDRDDNYIPIGTYLAPHAHSNCFKNNISFFRKNSSILFCSIT